MTFMIRGVSTVMTVGEFHQGRVTRRVVQPAIDRLCRGKVRVSPANLFTTARRLGEARSAWRCGWHWAGPRAAKPQASRSVRPIRYRRPQPGDPRQPGPSERQDVRPA